MDIAASWKNSESGIAIEKDFAALQNFLNVLGKIPGPQNIVLDPITDLVDKIGKTLIYVVDIERKKNDDYYALGFETNGKVQPGGKAVEDFMKAIWNTSLVVSKIKLKKNTIDFFNSKKEKLQLFLGVPMPDIEEDPRKFKLWVREYRKKIYVLIYGNRVTPDKIIDSNW